MQGTQPSNEPDGTSSRNSSEEESLTGEILEGKQHKEEDDIGRDGEEPSAEVVAMSSFWRRLRNVLLIFAAFWLAMTLLRATNRERPSKVVYANRYSEDYKFRPAASPILTERLQDGRTRIRGAEPTERAVPPVQEKSKSKSKSRKRRSSKQKTAKKREMTDD